MDSHLPTELTIDLGTLTLGGLEYGGSTAPPVVLLHGHADLAWSMDSVAQSLADRYRVVSVDLRGHGRSGWGPYTMVHLMSDLLGVIEVLELERPIIIGHSLGGQAAAQFCGVYPEIPRALVLVEGIGPPPHRSARSESERHERHSARWRVELVGQPATSRRYPDLQATLARFREMHPLLDPERAALLVAKGTRQFPDGSRQWLFDPASRDWVAAHDHDIAEQRWRGTTCPVQVVLGADAWNRFWKLRIPDAAELDGPMSATELQRRLSNFSDVRYDEISGAGHMVHYDRPAELNRVIAEFLESVENRVPKSV